LESKDSLLSLECVATAALEAGTILMEAGASAKSDEGIAQMIAHGLRAERVDLRVGYAWQSVSELITRESLASTRRGELGVNQRLFQALWCLARRVAGGQFTAEQTRLKLARLGKIRRDTQLGSPR
jgi:uncharacterized membrane protein YjjP (DUF1212 family)